MLGYGPSALPDSGTYRRASAVACSRPASFVSLGDQLVSGTSKIILAISSILPSVAF